uniref:DNA damage-regulated autophagy modulator protein 1-like n=1 Tax=Dermatophagoides pteronyssinus TaxID=6956 RepID=A0A6P6XU65_DERPT|nr:DNA damage-regulated autophagy modulator protein 1-like [Dermatophagoides pteronyssinus]
MDKKRKLTKNDNDDDDRDKTFDTVTNDNAISITEPFTTDTTIISARKAPKNNLPHIYIQPKKSKKRHLWLLPFVNGIMVIMACFVPYTISVSNGSIYPIWPLVSDAGAVTPAAGYFSTFLDIIAILTICVSIILSKQIRYYKWELLQRFKLDRPIDERNFNCLVLSRKIIKITSILISVGLFITGNFRSIENLTGHMIGVTIFLPSGLIYGFSLICVYLILDSYGIQSPPTMLIIVMMISLLSSIFCVVLTVLSLLKHGSIWQYYNNELRLQWNPTMSGYYLHVLGDVCEWITLLSFGPLNIIISRRFRMFKRWDCIKF